MKGLLNETDASLIADLKSVSREVNLFGTAHNPAVVEAFPKRWVQFDLDLNDSQIASYVDYEDCDHALINKSNSFVHVRGILSMKVDTLPYILAAEVGVLSPETHGPQIADLRLQRLAQRLTHDGLRAVVEDLRDPCGLGARFLYWQASTRYHHVYEGGLAIHSLDVAKALFIHPNIRPERREIMAVAGLVHDIGKLWTYDRDGRLTPTGKQLCHEQVNLEVLAPTLSKLDQRDPLLAAELRAAIPRGIGLKRGTLTVEEDFLRSADRTSAKSDQPDRYYPLPAAV